MFAIRNIRTKKWVYGTDWRYKPYCQRTSNDKVLLFEDLEEAEYEFTR